MRFILTTLFVISFSAKAEEVNCLPDESHPEISELNEINKKLNHKSTKSEVVCDKHASGAWFYKVATKKLSTEDIGIHVNGKLPEIKLDPKRYFSKTESGKPHFHDGPLDRPSVYLGGEVGGQELDAGLTWDREFDSNGEPKNSFAFRPFWRNLEDPSRPTQWHNPSLKQKVGATTQGCKELHSKDLGKECSSKNIYFQPGEGLEMSLKQLQSDDPVMQVRMVIKSKTDSTKCFAVCFPHHGNKSKGSTWKRVNSIDQFKTVKCGDDECRKGNENGVVIPTTSSAQGGKWDSVKVLQSDGTSKSLIPGKDAKIILGKEFCSKARNQKDKYFQTDKVDGNGGQLLSIIPSP